MKMIDFRKFSKLQIYIYIYKYIIYDIYDNNKNNIKKQKKNIYIYIHICKCQVPNFPLKPAFCKTPGHWGRWLSETEKNRGQNSQWRRSNHRRPMEARSTLWISSSSLWICHMLREGSGFSCCFLRFSVDFQVLTTHN